MDNLKSRNPTPRLQRTTADTDRPQREGKGGDAHAIVPTGDEAAGGVSHRLWSTWQRKEGGDGGVSGGGQRQRCRSGGEGG
jgi:hypothetical protein